MTNFPSKRLIHNTDAAIAVEDIMHGCQHVVERDDAFFTAEKAIHARFEALAGLDPAKLAALLAACDRYTIGPAPDGCGFCREGNCSATAHVAITAALAKLRGEESHRG